MFLLFDEVGAADEADCYFMAEGGEELEDFRSYGLYSLSLCFLVS